MSLERALGDRRASIPKTPRSLRYKPVFWECIEGDIKCVERASRCSKCRCDLAPLRGLRDALALVDIRVIDHLIGAGGGTDSFAEKGLL